MFITYCSVCDENTPHSQGICSVCKERERERLWQRQLEALKTLSLEERIERIERVLFIQNFTSANEVY